MDGVSSPQEVAHQLEEVVSAHFLCLIRHFLKILALVRFLFFHFFLVIYQKVKKNLFVSYFLGTVEELSVSERDTEVVLLDEG